MEDPINLEAIKTALLSSYKKNGGTNHLDGVNLPSAESVSAISRECMHLLFPGYFDERRLTEQDMPKHVESLLGDIARRLQVEIEKCLRFAGENNPGARARLLTLEALNKLPEVREVICTDLEAAYNGDPAALSSNEIILAYPCVLAISLQRLAHVLYHLKIPLLPRMITEFAHERTGIDIHPGAQIGSHFFIDHGTGVVIGETARIGSHVKFYQGVNLVAKSFEVDANGNPVKGGKRHPDVGDHVTIYAHATILGGTTHIGAHSVIGGNVWLLESVPANSIVYFKTDDIVIRPRQKKEALVGYVDDWVI